MKKKKIIIECYALCDIDRHGDVSEVNEVLEVIEVIEVE